jgi:hypothetical protein
MDSMKRFYLLALLMSFALHAEELHLKPNGSWVSWQKTADTQLRYVCEKNPCPLPESLSPSAFKKLSIDWEAGGTNPSAILCAKLSGTVGIARLKNGDEVSVCQLDEKVWVHGWDLYNLWKKTATP